MPGDGAGMIERLNDDSKATEVWWMQLWSDSRCTGICICCDWVTARGRLSCKEVTVVQEGDGRARGRRSCREGMGSFNGGFSTPAGELI